MESISASHNVCISQVQHFPATPEIIATYEQSLKALMRNEPPPAVVVIASRPSIAQVWNFII